MTFPELFATSLKLPLNPGAHRCFWCGASCDESHSVRVTNTFWDWDCVAFPQSKYQCVGCCECLDEKRVLDGYDKPQKTRNHSWYVTRQQAVNLTKGDRDRMVQICLHPPDTVWGLAIAESGQKHVLYRTPVNSGRGTACAVQLELTTVTYRPEQLRTVLADVALLGSVVGRPALSGPLDARQAVTLHTAGMDLQILEQWNAHHADPVYQLAAFLVPKKEECLEFSRSLNPGSVPQETGGTDRRQRSGRLFE